MLILLLLDFSVWRPTYWLSDVGNNDLALSHTSSTVSPHTWVHPCPCSPPMVKVWLNRCSLFASSWWYRCYWQWSHFLGLEYLFFLSYLLVFEFFGTPRMYLPNFVIFFGGFSMCSSLIYQTFLWWLFYVFITNLSNSSLTTKIFFLYIKYIK